MGIPDTHTMSISHYSNTLTAKTRYFNDAFVKLETPAPPRPSNNDLRHPNTNKEETAALVEELNRMNAENKRLTEMLVALCDNYSDLQRQVVDYMGKTISGGHLSSTPPTDTFLEVVTKTKLFKAAEIKKATCNYSDENIIGKGGSCTVFKGILPGNQLIAVKRPSKEFEMETFVDEIDILSRINNKNVVNLLGCCFETSVPSIVYEYIPNGSLSDHLFDEQKACFLTWNHRLRIAVQVAQVLDYLYNTISVPIIHRDIKPRNILLDDNYVAKVSDFGSSKLIDQHTWEIDGHYTCVVGTIGYMPPEYVLSGRLTHKTDVYSFGVVLAQLLTRRKAYGVELGDQYGFLANIFCEKLNEDRLVEILDEQLIYEESMEQLKKVADLAARCLQEEPEARPSTRQVVRLLEDIRGF